MNKTEERYTRFGMAMAEIKNQYWFDSVVEFLKDGNKEGEWYFSKLKPFYDKYGYTKVNNLLIKIYNEKKEANNE